MCTVYRIINLINKKSYIGITTRGVEQRIKQHLKLAEYGSGYYIHNAIKKYGKNNFLWGIVESNISSVEEAKEKEIEYIQVFNSFNPNGYNLTRGGDFTSNIGFTSAIINGVNTRITLKEFHSTNYKHINEGKVTIYKGEMTLRVSSDDYKNKYFDQGFRSSNSGFTTVKGVDGKCMKINKDDFDKSFHVGINSGLTVVKNKKTLKIEYLSIDNTEIDTKIYCNKVGKQFEIFNSKNELMQCINNMNDILDENGFSQFRYMFRKDRTKKVYEITKKVLKLLKKKKQNFNLIGYKLVIKEY